ncbi:methyltransferase [Paenibacillus sp. J31TS4]|uniref:class I SAM-dependent methyltransferase n=1 Tax=Paenibacillus sp. J31TS4 TaxID=2807195 RepID=UPI001B106599|nr:class I SAM-dependent methyltransferase [Paenibacillus sp. J31TS4]GIP39989.1 methyltransferase [Paenibacillus sp. J31TS4]
MEDRSKSTKELAMQQFGAHAGHYVTSALHAQGPDLKWLVEQAALSGTERLLDVATGGGHVVNALAPLVREAVACDLTPEMLEAARGLLAANGRTNVTFAEGDAEALPFGEAAFDLVTCRIAAHHFPDPNAFVRECRRVLRPDGRLLLVDNVCPEEPDADALYNEVEQTRDPSHFRAWTKAEWIARLEGAGLKVHSLEAFPKTFRFQDWCERMGVEPAVREHLERKLLDAPEPLRRRLGVQEEAGRLVSFAGESVLIAASPRA